MREIKFKAYDKVMEKMYEVGYIDFAKGKVQLANMIDGVCYAVYISPLKDVELLQYTGLKDKNGNEIYEGDIVKVNKLTFESSVPLPEVLNVKYYGGMFQLYRGDENLMGLHLGYIEECEVIGNIYQNSELIKN